MNTEQKLLVLKNIAREFNHAGITWALGASMLLYFKGVTSEFQDIDLMVANEDAIIAKETLSRMGIQGPPNPNPKYRTKMFMEFVIDEVDVDVMVGFAIVDGDTIHDCSLLKEQIVEFLDLDGEQIPLQSLALWCRYYELMGREKKVAMILPFLNQG